MNYFGARQRESDRRWDFTQKRDGSIWPVGYCSGKSEFSGSHEDGHASADEACACYRKYLLETSARFDEDRAASNTQHRCEAPDCTEWTSGVGMVDDTYRWWLCAQHRTHEMLEKLMPPVWTITSS